MRTYPGLDIQHDIQLSGYSTMGVTARAKYFIVLDNTEIFAEIVDFIKLSKIDFLVLGGGITLLLGDYAGVVLKNEIMGKEVVKEKMMSMFTLNVAVGKIGILLLNFV